MEVYIHCVKAKSEAVTYESNIYLITTQKNQSWKKMS